MKVYDRFKHTNFYDTSKLLLKIYLISYYYKRRLKNRPYIKKEN